MGQAEDAWRKGNNAGHGYEVGRPSDDINNIRGIGKLVQPSSNPDEIAIYKDGNTYIGVGDSHGPWAVDLPRHVVASSDLKSHLLKLGSTNPELIPNIQPILAKIGASADDFNYIHYNVEKLLAYTNLPESAKVNDAVFQLLKKGVGLDKGRWVTLIPVKAIPKLKSLFSDLTISVEYDIHNGTGWVSLEWKYTHPTGGKNGMSIGVANATGWRSADGKRG